MITIRYKGRTGNRLFQYATARLLSEKTGQAIYNPLKTKIISHGSITDSILFSKDLWINEKDFNKCIASEEIFSHNLYLDGYFQFRDLINIFLSKKEILFINNSKIIDGLFVHVRLGDIVNVKKNIIPSYNYYASLINKHKTLTYKVISTDSPNHEMVQCLIKEFNLELYTENNPEEAILFGSQFRTKILSSGTFSWWIGFLGCNETVYCPDPKKFDRWHGDIFPFMQWIAT
jgi:hypothetical protein